MGVNIRKLLGIVSVFSIVIFGIFLRTYVYSQGVSLFGDEGALVLKFYDKSYLDLFFPLGDYQQAPPIFLIISKFMLMRFGLSEIMLRFVSYFSSIVALVLFCLLCFKLFKNYLPILVATFLFSFNIHLVEFSQILKQYSSDVLFSVLAMLVVFNIKFDKLDNIKILYLSLSTIISFWFSYSMVIIAGAFAIVFLVKSFLSKNANDIKYSLLFSIVNLLGLSLYYFTNLYGTRDSKGLHDAWVNMYGFFPNSYHEISNLIKFLFNIDSLSGIIFILSLFILGSFFFFKKDKFKFWIVISPVITVLLAGALGIYPFAERLVTFLIPNMIIILVYSLEVIDYKKISVKNVLIVLFFVIFIYYTKLIPYYVYFMKSNANYEKSFAREYVAMLKQEKISDKSIIYVNAPSRESFTAYSRGSNISNHIVVNEAWGNPLKTLNSLPHGEDVYFFIFYNFVFPKETFYLTQESWINKNCVIKKNIVTANGKFIKCYVR